MNKTRPCGCKGCRTCLICENDFNIDGKFYSENRDNCYTYCPQCNMAWKGWDSSSIGEHPNHSGDSMRFPGVFIELDFFTEAQENITMKGIDEIPWDLSQSGRKNRRSLLVLYGNARYNWEHCVLREDIKERRVCIAYREFTPPFLPGGDWENEGSEILDAANSFWNHLYVDKECL